MIRSRLLRRTALAGAALVLLSGCGHTPGTAIRVGDTSVTRSDVDTFVDGICRLNGTNPQNTPAPRSKMVWQVANLIVQSIAINDYADSLGITADSTTLQRSLSLIDPDVSKLPAHEADVYRAQATSIITGQLRAETIGLAALQSRGTANPTQQQALAAGAAVAMAWAKKHEPIDVDPRYNLGASDIAGAGDGSMSRAVSSFAKQAASGSADTSFVAALPVDQRCG